MQTCQIADYIEATDGDRPEPCLDFATHTISFTVGYCVSFHYHVCSAHYNKVLAAAKLYEKQMQREMYKSSKKLKREVEVFTDSLVFDGSISLFYPFSNKEQA